MKVLFDTNVIVAALVEDHEMYALCQPWLNRVQANEAVNGFVSTHSLAESYSILTRLPLRRRIGPRGAHQLLTENLDQFTKVSLTAEDYEIAIAKIVQLNIMGGGIFDALIAQAALKAEVDSLLTFNAKHFTRLGVEVAQLVQIPS